MEKLTKEQIDQIPPFPPGGFSIRQGGEYLPDDEMIVTEEQMARLKDLLHKLPFAEANLTGEQMMRVTLSKQSFPKVEINPTLVDEEIQHHDTMDLLEQFRKAHQKTRLEDNHAVMEFLEDIIYCPSQIEFYFRDESNHNNDNVLCLYIRQRHGETTAELVPCYPSGDFKYGDGWIFIELSRDYDIEGESHKSNEAEEQEIIAIEKECLNKLRTFFPGTTFPEHPNRRRGRYGKRLPDVKL